jgi:hypothetical protein
LTISFRSWVVCFAMPLKKLAMREVRLTYRAFEGLVFPRLLAAAPEG